MQLEKVRNLIEPIIRESGCELVDVRIVSEQGRRILRVFIDREGGVRLSDCERVSRDIETVLDVEEAVGDRYYLEVSSPGLNRPLIKEEDYRRYTGRNIDVTTREPIDGRRHYKGLLKGVEEGVLVIEIDRRDWRVPLKLIGKGHLVY